MAERVCHSLGHDRADDHFGVVHVMHRDDAAKLPTQNGWRNTDSVFEDYGESDTRNISLVAVNRWRYAQRTEMCGELVLFVPCDSLRECVRCQ
jgi:hypothetical protein